MKKNLGIGLVVFGLLWLPFLLSAGVTEKVIEKTLPLEAGHRFSLKNINGSITVKTWERPEVHIYALLRTKENNPSRAERLLEETEVIITEEGGDVMVSTRLPKRGSSGGRFLSWILGGVGSGVSVHYTITLPAGVEATLRSTNGGIDVENFRGELRVRTTNGRIGIKKAGGSVTAATTNGSIRAELVTVAEQADINLKTTNGSITLKLPEDFNGEIDARTVNGSITTELPVTFEGKFTKRRLRGYVGSGNSDVHCELTTTNGSISIRKLDEEHEEEK